MGEIAVKVVYNLIMVDEDYHIEGFDIGYFSSYDKAEKTAKRYLTEVDGFKDYNVTYRIIEKSIIGCSDSLPTVIFVISGWNENDEFDEIDVIESNCYVNKNDAEQELIEMQTIYCRKEWAIGREIIDKCSWQDGFIRVYR